MLLAAVITDLMPSGIRKKRVCAAFEKSANPPTDVLARRTERARPNSPNRQTGWLTAFKYGDRCDPVDSAQKYENRQLGLPLDRSGHGVPYHFLSNLRRFEDKPPATILVNYTT